MTPRERNATRLMTFAAGCLLASAALAQEGIETPNYGGEPEYLANLAEVDRPPGADVTIQARAAFDAVQKGDWWMAVAVALSIGVLGARRFLATQRGLWLFPDDASWRGRLRRWLLSGEGGVVLTVLGAFLSGAVAAFAAHVPFGSEWIDTVLKVSLAALGGYSGIKATVSGKAKEERTERRETTDALKSGLKSAPHLADDPRPVVKP